MSVHHQIQDYLPSYSIINKMPVFDFISLCLCFSSLWQNNWRPSQSSRVSARSSSLRSRCSWRRLRQNTWCAASNTPSPGTWCSSSTAQTLWMTSSCRRYRLRGDFVSFWRFCQTFFYKSLFGLLIGLGCEKQTNPRKDRESTSGTVFKIVWGFQTLQLFN